MMGFSWSSFLLSQLWNLPVFVVALVGIIMAFIR